MDDDVDELYIGDQALPHADLARGAGRAARAGAGPTSSRSRSTWSRSATSSSACCRTSRTRRSRKRRSFSEAGHGRDLRPARAAARQPAPRHERVPERRPEERAAPARGEGALPRPGARSTPTRTSPASPATRSQSIETSSLHLDLISDLKRINSHICSIAYPILEQAGALHARRASASRSFDAARRRPTTARTA